MRRIAAALLVPVAAAIALAGCGSSSPGSPAAANSNAAVKVTGSFDKQPSVSIPAKKASANLVIQTPIKGTGAVLTPGDNELANIAVYKWSGTKHTLLDSTFASGPQMIPSQMGLPGLTTALKTAHLGSRIVAVLPPKFGYGKNGQSQLQVTGTDTLVWVIDLIQQFSAGQAASGTQVSNGGGQLPTVTAKPGQAPVIAMPKNSPPAKLSVTTLIKGSGPKLTNGDTVVAEYVGSIWRTGKVFSSTWPTSTQPNGIPFSFKLGGGVIKGWNEALAGVPVGSRVMLAIPPSLGYGKQGQPSAGIKSNDTLVFVIDVLAAQPAA
ncbi:MAG TPA: FKBP-type peptidyl-prolyl cis-trans isomerase [Streptosporangiaceae bacterium]|jgi:FKBP-type peptidyl-prolyl cis-trans isomerase|nr:FKBP-type peptidyl-prolyl cis-trans isomerase [Streptosporangiaceae bacterium]